MALPRQQRAVYKMKTRRMALAACGTEMLVLLWGMQVECKCWPQMKRQARRGPGVVMGPPPAPRNTQNATNYEMGKDNY